MLTKKHKTRKPNPRRRFNPELTPLDEFHELMEKRASRNAAESNGDWFVYNAIDDCIFQYAENRESDTEFSRNGILRKLERIEVIVNSVHKQFSKTLEFDK